jgi:four helix bundle protein
VKFETWEKAIPPVIKADPLWSLRVYRSALYASHVGRRDAAWLARQPRLIGLADQLLRATTSISANIAEGYSRLGKKDRGRFYEYALGSARESRDWYLKIRDELGPETNDARLALHTGIIRVMIVLVMRSRPASSHVT